MHPFGLLGKILGVGKRKSVCAPTFVCASAGESVCVNVCELVKKRERDILRARKWMYFKREGENRSSETRNTFSP